MSILSRRSFLGSAVGSVTLPGALAGAATTAAVHAQTPRGQRLPARGRFWINPNTGAVLMSELVIKGEGVNAAITVSYQSEPLLGFLVPVAMNESYEGRGEHVVGSATYGQFRQLTK